MRAASLHASGRAKPDAKTFEVCAERGATDYGNTLLMLRGKEPFRHTDENTLRKIAEPTPNPPAR